MLLEIDHDKKAIICTPRKDEIETIKSFIESVEENHVNLEISKLKKLLEMLDERSE